MRQNAYCMLMTTVADKQTAVALTQKLLAQKLAACVQHVAIESFYTFEGKDCREPEVLLLLKTKTALYDQIEALFVKEHPYKTPELVQVPIDNGLAAYLAWVDEVTR